MYCGKCGSFNADGSPFCQNCGSPLAAQAAPQQPYPQQPYLQQPYLQQQPPKKKKTGLIIGICVAIAAVVTGLVFLGIWLFGDDGPLGGGGSGGGGSRDDDGKVSDAKGGFASAEAVSKAYVAAMASGDVDAVMNLYPKKVLDACLEGEGLTKKEFRKELQELYGALDLEVMDAAEVSFTMVVNFKDEDGDKDTADNGEAQQPVVKIGGRWYLHAPEFWDSINLPDDDDEPSKNGFSSAKAAVEAEIKAEYEDMDAEAYLALLPEKMIDAVLEEEDITLKELRKEIQDMLNEEQEYLEDEYGEGCCVSAEILEMEPFEESDLQELQEEYEEYYGLEVTDAATAYIMFFIVYPDGDTEDLSEDELFAVKIDGRWYPHSY